MLRLYDEASTKTLVKRVLNLDLNGAYLILGFDGFAEIAAAQEKRALDICAELGARDLGRESGEHWWQASLRLLLPTARSGFATHGWHY